jgi:hypothetical protein
MPLDLARVIRQKAAIDEGLQSVADDDAGAYNILTDMYTRARKSCLQMVGEDDSQWEFYELFPEWYGHDLGPDANKQYARSLLKQLSAWLGAWPSTNGLLDELIRTLEQGEDDAETEEQRTWYRGILHALKGPGREIGVQVVAAWLERVTGPVPRP